MALSFFDLFRNLHRASQRQMEGSASSKHFVVGRVLSGPTARVYYLEAPASVMPAERWKFPHQVPEWRFPLARRLDLETRTSVIPSVYRRTEPNQPTNQPTTNTKTTYPRPNTKQKSNLQNRPTEDKPRIQSHNQPNNQTTKQPNNQATTQPSHSVGKYRGIQVDLYVHYARKHPAARRQYAADVVRPLVEITAEQRQRLRPTGALRCSMFCLDATCRTRLQHVVLGCSMLRHVAIFFVRPLIEVQHQCLARYRLAHIAS